MSTFANLTIRQLREALAIREKIEGLEKELNEIWGGGNPAPVVSAPGGRRTMSAAARARIGAAQRARWAKQRKSSAAVATGTRRRNVSAAVRAARSASAKARWKKAKAAGKTHL
jgi:hypothetical protein